MELDALTRSVTRGRQDTTENNEQRRSDHGSLSPDSITDQTDNDLTDDLCSSGVCVMSEATSLPPTRRELDTLVWTALVYDDL